MYKSIWTVTLPSSLDTLYSYDIAKDLRDQNKGPSFLSPCVKMYVHSSSTHHTHTHSPLAAPWPLWQYFYNSIIGKSTHPILPGFQAENLEFRWTCLLCAIYNQDPIPPCPHLCHYPNPYLPCPYLDICLVGLPACPIFYRAAVKPVALTAFCFTLNKPQRQNCDFKRLPVIFLSLILFWLGLVFAVCWCRGWCQGLMFPI